MLKNCSMGFGGLALASLTQAKLSHAIENKIVRNPNPKVKRVVFLFMAGGVSHIDSFDPKPELDKLDGKLTGPRSKRKYLKSPWAFKQYGEAGIPVSELFPHIAKHVDELTFIRSMKADFPLHSRGNLFLHTGRNVPGAPSIGSWVNYGLGHESEELPGYIVLNDGEIPAGGMENFASAYLPANYQASMLSAEGVPLKNLVPHDDQKLQRLKLDLVSELDARSAELDSSIESAIKNYEIAFRMQSRVPEIMDLSQESTAIQTSYGIDSSNKAMADYGRQCLRTRRLLEAGVPFVEISMFGTGNGGWDQHRDLRKTHAANALTVDQPVSALLTDLKRSGLWDDTLVVFTGEMGRTIDTGNGDGRDHHVDGFTAWLAGGSLRGGMIHGATDELGQHAVENICSIHDFHATILHLLGFDHEQLTFRFGGRDMRLTDVHGKVLHSIIA